MYSFLPKFLITGPSGSGKTALTRFLLKEESSSRYYAPTIGAFDLHQFDLTMKYDALATAAYKDTVLNELKQHENIEELNHQEVKIGCSLLESSLLDNLDEHSKKFILKKTELAFICIPATATNPQEIYSEYYDKLLSNDINPIKPIKICAVITKNNFMTDAQMTNEVKRFIETFEASTETAVDSNVKDIVTFSALARDSAREVQQENLDELFLSVVSDSFYQYQEKKKEAKIRRIEEEKHASQKKGGVFSSLKNFANKILTPLRNATASFKSFFSGLKQIRLFSRKKKLRLEKPTDWLNTQIEREFSSVSPLAASYFSDEIDAQTYFTTVCSDKLSPLQIIAKDSSKSYLNDILDKVQRDKYCGLFIHLSHLNHSVQSSLFNMMEQLVGSDDLSIEFLKNLKSEGNDSISVSSQPQNSQRLLTLIDETIQCCKEEQELSTAEWTKEDKNERGRSRSFRSQFTVVSNCFRRASNSLDSQDSITSAKNRFKSSSPNMVPGM